jgi:uncharacterized membrane protein YphA (DoxX/SURF4 family)
MDNQPGLLRRLDRIGGLFVVARLFLGGMFIYTGIVKAMDPDSFMKMVKQYDMVPLHPQYFINLIAAVLPWLEIWCGLLLIVGVATRGSALLILTMLVGFTIAVTVRALHIHQTVGTPFCAIYFNCGCGTGVEWICGKIPKNVGMCLLSLIILFSKSQRFCLDSLLRPGPKPPALEVASPSR